MRNVEKITRRSRHECDVDISTIKNRAKKWVQQRGGVNRNMKRNWN